MAAALGAYSVAEVRVYSHCPRKIGQRAQESASNSDGSGNSEWLASGYSRSLHEGHERQLEEKSKWSVLNRSLERQPALHSRSG